MEFWLFTFNSDVPLVLAQKAHAVNRTIAASRELSSPEYFPMRNTGTGSVLNGGRV